jgi:hypothetical protein
MDLTALVQNTDSAVARQDIYCQMASRNSWSRMSERSTFSLCTTKALLPRLRTTFPAETALSFSRGMYFRTYYPSSSPLTVGRQSQGIGRKGDKRCSTVTVGRVDRDTFHVPMFYAITHTHAINSANVHPIGLPCGRLVYQ